MPLLSACRKSLFDKLLQVFLHSKSAEKLMIENERHLSRVSFVTIFLPVVQGFAFLTGSFSHLLRVCNGFLESPVLKWLVAE